MKYYKLMILMSFFFSNNSHSIDFKLTPSDSFDGIEYFTLHVLNVNKVKHIDVALEGNSNNAIIRQYYSFPCIWGKASGVRLSMDSATAEGKLVFDNIYVVDNQLNILFAKSYSRKGNKWIDPVNLNHSVCNRLSGGIKKDVLTKKDYIVDFETIEQGPFHLKGVDNVSIKYIRDDSLKLVRDDINGETVVDSIKNYNDNAPFIRVVFFIKIKSEMHIISLISWGEGGGENSYYKIYSYLYDKNGIIHNNEELNRDLNLSGYDSEKQMFKYKDASAIKKYILEHYNF